MSKIILLCLISVASIDCIGKIKEYDICVYGGTPGGITSAISAAREGASVVLLEQTRHVGGLTTSGLNRDECNHLDRPTLGGLCEQFIEEAVKRSKGKWTEGNYRTWQSGIAERVFLEMLKKAGVEVRYEQLLDQVEKDGTRITELRVQGGKIYRAKVFIDATYEGDLMAAADVDWTIGRESRETHGESLAGRQYPKAVMPIDGFDDAGEPLPLITAVAKGEDTTGDANLMTYSFRLCLTKEPANRLPMPEPAHYDPARFEVVRRALAAGETRVGFDLYPLPGNKFDGNNSIGGQFSIGLIGGGTAWHDANEAGREAIWEAHKQYTLEFFHFLTTDPAVPPKIRDRFAGLGLCRDEFESTGHFSPALYVRESRRLQGMAVITQQVILDEPEQDSPIAISSFPIDSHDCRRIALPDGGVVNEGTIFPVRRKNRQGYAYQVPYAAILPKPQQCDNLLVPVAVSSTHVGMSSLRIEGAWMAIGQGAGVAAALAAKSDVAVHALSYPLLRERLIAQGQVLTLPAAAKSPEDR